jgi:hypothetical protein
LVVRRKRATAPWRCPLKTLAEVVVFLMEQLTMAEQPGIDWQACGDITNDVWGEQLRWASPAERQALAEAAAARLRELLREPDEYGYTPRALVTPAQREFLESLADGSAWHEFDHPEAPDAEPGAAPDRGRM